MKSDGTVVAWGDTTGGATSVPAGLKSVIALGAGFESSLAIASPLDILSNPANQSVQVGQLATFGATVDGAAATAQWQVSADARATWIPIPGTTDPTLSFTAQVSLNGTQYRYFVSNLTNSAVTTPAILTVLPAVGGGDCTVNCGPSTSATPEIDSLLLFGSGLSGLPA